MSGRSTSRDTYGWKRGNGAYSKDDLSFGAPSKKRDKNDASSKLFGLDDDDSGMGSGSKWLGGGGPLSKSRGVGSGPPKFRPKTGPRTNGGVNGR
jgi:hypothetical protein